MEYIISNKVAGLQGSTIREMFKMLADPQMISFAGGAPAPETFPVDELAKIAEDILKNEGRIALQYGITEGQPALSAFTRERAEHNALLKEGDDMIITSGGQQGIDLTAKVLLNEGDTVICENPSFIGALNSFRSYGAKLCGIACEEDGMDMDALEQVLKTEKNVKLIYTIPTFQNPSGITMSLEKRKRLLALAEQYGVAVLEDNPYGDLRFEGEKLPTLKSLDTGNTVIYVGTYSKTLSPGLRLGFLIGDAKVIDKVTVCKQVNDVHTNVLSQMIAAEYFKRYSYDEHVKKLSVVYRHKCGLMLSCLEKYLPDTCSWTHPQGGLFIWGTIHKDVDTNDVSKLCIAKKVAFVPGSTFMADMAQKCSSFRLNYATMSDEAIDKGIHILGDVLKTI